MDERKDGNRRISRNNVTRITTPYNPRYAQQEQEVRKRKLRNTVGRNTNKVNARSNMTKQQRRRLANQSKLRLASFALITGIALGGVGLPTLISTLARNYNSAKDSKEAIEIANEYDEFIAEIEQNSQITSVEDIEGLKQLEDAIARYTALKYKPDKTFNEEQEYLEVCRTICESKYLVIDTYTDSIKNKVAEAYGITDPKLIDIIEVKDDIHIENSDGKAYHNRVIDTKGFGKIVDNIRLDTDVQMPEELAQNVTNARKLRDVCYNPDEMTTEELPVDEIIDTFQEAVTFDNYRIVRDENGNLFMEQIEQDKGQEQSEDLER